MRNQASCLTDLNPESKVVVTKRVSDALLRNRAWRGSHCWKIAIAKGVSLPLKTRSQSLASTIHLPFRSYPSGEGLRIVGTLCSVRGSVIVSRASS